MSRRLARGKLPDKGTDIPAPRDELKGRQDCFRDTGLEDHAAVTSFILSVKFIGSSVKGTSHSEGMGFPRNRG